MASIQQAISVVCCRTTWIARNKLTSASASCRPINNATKRATSSQPMFSVSAAVTAPTSIGLVLNRFYSDTAPTGLSFEAVHALIHSQDIQLIDVREPEEAWKTGSVDPAVLIPLGELKAALELSEERFIEHYGREKPLRFDMNIVFMSYRGPRSKAAVEIASVLGYRSRYFEGGFSEWTKHQKKTLF